MLSHENKTSSGNKIIGCLLFSLCTWKHYCCWQLQYSNWDTNCSWKMVWVDIKLHETIKIQGCITTLTTSNFNKSFTLEIIFTKRISWIYLFGIYCVKQSLQSYRWRNMSICFENIYISDLSNFVFHEQSATFFNIWNYTKFYAKCNEMFDVVASWLTWMFLRGNVCSVIFAQCMPGKYNSFQICES